MNIGKTTVSQQLIWMDQAMNPGSAKYNIGGYAWLEGKLDYRCFNSAVQTVLKSQDIYSTVFSEADGELQCFLKEIANNYVIEVLDFSGQPEAEKSAMDWMEDDFSKAFDTRGKLLFIFKLIKISNRKHFWYAKIHHLIGDGWSFKLLMNQAAGFYTAFCNGDSVEYPVYRYSDYVIDDEAYYRSQQATDDRNYWLSEYEALPPALFQKMYHTAGDSIAGSETLQTGPELKERLQQIADANKVSLFHIIVTLLIIYFGRTSQQSAIAIGVPVLNRTKKVYRQTAGVFMNLLSLKFEMQDTYTVSDLLNAVKQKMSASLRHQRYQYGNLVKDLQLSRSRKLLYDIRISYEDFDFTSDFGGLKAGATALSNKAEVDPLAIYVREYSGQGFDIRFIYNTAYFSRERMQSVCSSLENMLSLFPGDTGIPVHSIPILNEKEKLKMLEMCYGETRQWDHCTFPVLWQQAVVAYPQNIAVSCGGKEFSYEEIHRQVIKLAAAMIRYREPQPAPIAILLPRSEKLIVAMIAATVAGIPYIPVDPDYPESRIRYMLQDISCPVLLTNDDHAAGYLNDLPLHVLNADRIAEGTEVSADIAATQVPETAPCYIIYTSGSTGTPKGVIISHRSLADYVVTFREYFALTTKDVVLQQSSVGFDTSVEEIFPILTTGGRLHILENRKDLPDLKRSLAEEKITILSTNPWVLKFLDNELLPSSLRIVISGGDVLKPGYVKNILRQGIAVYNSYGPTESTVCATYYRMQKDESIIPIGRPIANRRVYILDACMQLQPPGVEGEICIGGEGLALSYTDLLLTKEKFVPDPFFPDRKIYPTGDRGLMREDGNILFRGRIDDQLNYRGYRIETQEIETVINQLDGVENCIVAVKEAEGTPLLVAYVKYKNAGVVHTKEWKRLLARQLPGYMVPDIWKPVQGFPLLPNGKVNKKALPPVDAIVTDNAADAKALPESPQEKQVYDIWMTVLNQAGTGIDDSFFESGGHSLNVVQLIVLLKEKFHIRVGIQDIFENDTIRKQAAFISRADILEQLPAIDNNVVADYPLLPAQGRIWILSQLPEAARAYHISGAVRLEGNINNDHIAHTVAVIISRHTSLRTVFYENEKGEIRQKVLMPEQLPGNIHEYIHAGTDGAELHQVLHSFIARPFNLVQGPLLRTALIRVDASTFLFVYVLHHIVSDGWSMEILLREFVAIYAARAAGKEPQLPATGNQLREYIIRSQHLHKLRNSNSRDYWIHRLTGKLPVIEWPSQYPRPAVKTYAGSEVTKYFDRDHYNRLLAFCEQERITLFTGLFATLNALVYRYTGAETTVIGTPVSNRYEAGLQDQVGLFLNMLPVKTVFKGVVSFRELLQLQKEELVQSYKHQDYDIEELLHELHQRNDPSRSPLFDVLIVLHNQSVISHSGKEEGDYVIPGVRIDLYNDLPRGTSQFDMTFAFFYEGGTIKLRLEYNTSIFESWFIHQLAGHFISLSLQLLEHPERPVCLLPYISASEHHLLTAAFYQPYNNQEYKHLAEFLYEWAAKSPESIAVAGEMNRITYASLLQMAENTAHYLVHIGKVKEGDRIGVIVEPDEWLPACLLGIWLAGAIYVPVNPRYPELRRQMILEDADCRVILDQHAIAHIKDYNAGDERFPPRSHPVSYILYTSGTTGKPKGVVVSHAALLEKLQAELEYISGSRPVNSCLFTNYCFDVSFLELLLPLITGGKIIIPGASWLQQQEITVKMLVNEQINVLHGTPSFIDSLLGDLPADIFRQLDAVLKVICLGGESLYGKLVRFLKEKLPAVQLNNHYGPTEAVIHAVVNKDVQRFEKNIIGNAMPGVRAYVLDRHLQPVPAGITGELYIGGKNATGKGYLNMPDETAGKFIDNPFVNDEKIYKTGDLVRWTVDHQLEYIGRTDEQVKIRGFRIEPEDIQRVLEQYAPVKQGVVMPYRQPGGNVLLIAFVVSDEIIDEQSLKVYLKKHLPDYMIPSELIWLQEMPLNENGKADRDQLLGLVNLSARKETIVAPRNTTDGQLVMIWEQLLHRSPIGIRDNFFDLGGNSILLVKMRAEIRKTMDMHLDIKELLNFSMIEELSDAIDSLRWLRQDTGSTESRELNEYTV